MNLTSLERRLLVLLFGNDYKNESLETIRFLAAEEIKTPARAAQDTETPTAGSTGVRQRGNLYWIIQALRPNIKIRITTDWEPKYRLWRFLRKGNCEICGRRFREMEGGTISKRETLCETHRMMTTQEIADHHRSNSQH